MAYMHSLKVSNRLTRIASYLPSGAIFADIGSDHAYLPCFVCLYDHKAHAIAGEVNKEPYSHAIDTIKSMGLTEQIEARLGNGLQVLAPNEVRQIVISGMGGSLIRDILQEGIDKVQMVERIIVQPNIGEPVVRKLLMEHQYALKYEELVEENGHIYEILVADKSEQLKRLTEKQLLFGPILLQNQSALFYKKWEFEYEKRRKTVDQMKQAHHTDQAKINHYKKELTWIGEVLQYETID